MTTEDREYPEAYANWNGFSSVENWKKYQRELPIREMAANAMSELGITSKEKEESLFRYYLQTYNNTIKGGLLNA